MFLDIQYKWQYTCPSQLNQTNSIFYFKITPQGITVSIWTELYLQDHEDSDKSLCCYNVIMGPDHKYGRSDFATYRYVISLGNTVCRLTYNSALNRYIYVYILCTFVHMAHTFINLETYFAVSPWT